MSRTYKATGINLKGQPIGEADRLLTILTPEFGLIRAVAKGSRKQPSKFGGRGELFVVNQLLIARGRSLDKIAQAETVTSYPGLGRNLAKLAVSQYLAELTLFQALSDQPQVALFDALNAHLKQLETLPTAETEDGAHAAIAAMLVQAMLDLLTLAGIVPQLDRCCLTQVAIEPALEQSTWMAGFSAASGGAIAPAELERLIQEDLVPTPRKRNQSANRLSSMSAYSAAGQSESASVAAETADNSYPTAVSWRRSPSPHRTRLRHSRDRVLRLTALELLLLQQLTAPAVASEEVADGSPVSQKGAVPPPIFATSNIEVPDPIWLNLERILRQYAQYHFGRPIRSATLLDTCFSSLLIADPPLQP